MVMGVDGLFLDVLPVEELAIISVCPGPTVSSRPVQTSQRKKRGRAKSHVLSDPGSHDSAHPDVDKIEIRRIDPIAFERSTEGVDELTMVCHGMTGKEEK
jgi:hypothetical protein